MDKRVAFALLAAAGVGFVLWNWGIAAPVVAVGYVLNTFDRGNKLSDSTVVSGVVSESPEVLTDMASAVLGFTADVDTYSLARMGRSEGVDGMEYRMHVLLNDMADLQARYGMTYDTVTDLLTHSKIARADGHYSEQNLGKRYATTKDPYEGDYLLAQKVLADRARGIDLVDGATKFVDKSGPFYIHDPITGASVKTDYNGIVAEWAKDGFHPENLQGATDNFVVFTKDVG
jgi:hypothetical protein